MIAVPQVRAQAVQACGRGGCGRSPPLLEKVLALADDPDAAVRFQTALALGESDDPQVAPALAAASHAAMPRTRGCVRAVLCSSSSGGRADAGRSVGCAELRGAEGPAADPIADCCSISLRQIVGARNGRPEIDRVLDHLAAKSNDAGRRELRDGLVLALAHGARRSGGRLGELGPVRAARGLACWRA